MEREKKKKTEGGNFVFNFFLKNHFKTNFIYII